MKYYLTGLGVLTLVILVIIGCDSQYEQTVEVQAVSPNLEITNKTDTPVFFYAIENKTAARIRLADPCTDFQPNLSANATIKLPYEDIMGYDEEAELVYFLWTNCSGAGSSYTYPLYP